MLKTGKVHHGVFTLELSGGSSLYHLDVDGPVPFPTMVATGFPNADACTAFMYNASARSCDMSCNAGKACPASMGVGCKGCPTYNVFDAVQYATYQGACPLYPKGSAWVLDQPATVDDDGTKTKGDFLFTYCFQDTTPVYLHQQFKAAADAVESSPIARVLLGSAAEATDDDGGVVDVLYDVKSFSATTPPASDFAAPSYCTC